jgi:hypothetical protein
VRARVAHGGHNIPEADIRRRFDQSRLQLIELLPYLQELRLYDNTQEADPKQGQMPTPQPILRWLKQPDGQGIAALGAPMNKIPQWCKAVVMAALKLSAPKT